MNRRLAVLTALATGGLVALAPLGAATTATAADARPGRVTATPVSTPGPGAAAGAALTEPGHGTDPANPAGCDALDPAGCLLPFPSDFQTKPDATSGTGRRLDLTVAAMPRNTAGKPIEPMEHNRSDGFSPGQPIVTRVPGLDTPADAAASRIPPVTDMARSFDPDAARRADRRHHRAAPARSGPRWTATGPRRRYLIIHPAVNLAEDTRYVVALRNLRTAAGTAIPAGATFAGYRDGTRTDARTAHMDEVFADLAGAGIGRSDLFLAWDFTVASADNITGRLLSIRDRAFAELGDTNLADLTVAGRSPAFTVDRVENFTPAQNSVTARRVTLHVEVPCFITPDCATPEAAQPALPSGAPVSAVPPVGSGQFGYASTDPDAVPLRAATDFSAVVTCNIPRRAIDGPAPEQVRPSLYGHGLFGQGTEANAGHSREFGQRHGLMLCGPDWFGMATQDVPNALVALNDLSRFPLLIDRVQQGILNFMVVGRAMIHPQGLASDPAFQVSGRPVFDTTRLFYDGNSQGGIYGATLTAVAPDFDRAVLGVPGINYAVLLERSSDYKAREGDVGYSTALEASYPDADARALILSINQILWDRGDPNGYALHLTSDPLPNTPPHEVLFQVGYGDHQVANVTADVAARSAGAVVLRPALEPGRSVDVQPYFGIPSAPSYPYAGSAMTVFDIGPVRTEGTQTVGTGTPPTTNTPPRDGQDPHEAPRRALCGQQQKSDFLQVDGLVTDPCPGPYLAFTYTGAAPTPVVPEVPLTVLLPLAGLAVVAVLRRRREV